MRPAAKLCTVCRRTYRAGYAAHAATKTHRQAAARAEQRRLPSSRAMRGGRTAARGRAAGQARRSEDDYLSRTTVRVKRHKRSRPNDGRAKVVAVTRHYRHRPDTYRELHRSHDGKHWYAVTRRGSTGEALSVRYVSAKVAAAWQGLRYDR